MPDTFSRVLMVAFSVVAAVALFSGVRRSVKNRDQWSKGALLGALIVILTFSFVQLLATYTDSWVKVTDVYRDVSYSVPEWGQASLRVIMIPTALGGLAVLFAGLRRRDSQVNIPAVLLVTVLVISMAAALLHGDIPLESFPLVYLCILLACVFAPRGLGVHLGIATVCMIAAIASGFAMILHGDFSVIECVAGRKCGLLGFNFRGVLDNENALALYLALAMPFVYIGFRGWEGLVMAAYLTFLVVTTGSRSGTLTALVTLAVLLVARPDIRRPARTPVRSAILGTGLAGTLVAGLLLPMIIRDPAALSGRAYLWQVARGELADPSVFFYGAGMFGWRHLHEEGLVNASAVYSVHNQWLHVFFSTGIIGLACFLGALAILLWQARNGYFLVAASVLTPVFVLAATERPWPIDTADWLTWAVPGALLCYPLLRAPSSPPDDDDVGSAPASRREVSA
ncbi:Uncharacterised protein [Mycolicibacterium vanbaalenii]|uniref:O-antigen ligase-related domain-containing protein n=1 Tax=Mycolicibacterium vanbaalenii TaxID=110539 RepID=A0A5S9R366_MYCVN|nr:O-antigen ligase family protein [Mycolicibacterium vanbaalenii]CAA0128263.1 Uncharacterised protein [Mycolicibacterium vanbaalenii]